MILWSTIFGLLGFLAGMQIIGATSAAIVSTVEPVGAALLGWLALGQSLTIVEIGGIGAIIVAATLLRSERA